MQLEDMSTADLIALVKRQEKELAAVPAHPGMRHEVTLPNGITKVMKGNKIIGLKTDGIVVPNYVSGTKRQSATVFQEPFGWVDKQSELSQRLRRAAKTNATIQAGYDAEFIAAADEIDRYYTEMLKWKAKAEAKYSQPVQQPAPVASIGSHKPFELAAKALYSNWTPEKVNHLIATADAYVAQHAAPVAAPVAMPAASVQPDPEWPAGEREAWKLGYAAARQPDSGRDAALVDDPTEEMLNAARDWAVKKYGIGIGNDAAIGCWKAMRAAHPANVASVPGAGAAIQNLIDKLDHHYRHIYGSSEHAASALPPMSVNGFDVTYGCEDIRMKSSIRITPEQIMEYDKHCTREQAERLARQINQQ